MSARHCAATIVPRNCCPNFTSSWWWSRVSCPRTSVDLLGTNCDQCRSMVECCFTSMETVGLLGTGAQDVHLDFHYTVPELWQGDLAFRHAWSLGLSLDLAAHLSVIWHVTLSALFWLNVFNADRCPWRGTGGDRQTRRWGKRGYRPCLVTRGDWHPRRWGKRGYRPCLVTRGNEIPEGGGRGAIGLFWLLAGTGIPEGWTKRGYRPCLVTSGDWDPRRLEEGLSALFGY